MGHTDVVPVNPDGWSRGPVRRRARRRRGVGARRHRHAQHHGVDGGGRSRLAGEGFRPKGTLIYFGVADEEAGGALGAEWMLDQHWDVVGADFVLTELGGWSTARRRRRPPRRRQRRREGSRLAAPARHRHARPRFDAVSAPTTRSSTPPRSSAASRPTAPQPRLGDLWEAFVAGMRRRTGDAGDADRSRRGSTTRSRRSTRPGRGSPTPARTRRSRRTSPTAGRRPTRSPTSSTSTSTSAPCPATRSTTASRLPRRCARRACRARSRSSVLQHAEPTALADRQRAVGRRRTAGAGRLSRRRAASPA